MELGSYYKAAEHMKMFINVTYFKSGNCISIKCHGRPTVFPCRDAVVMVPNRIVFLWVVCLKEWSFFSDMG